MHVTDGKRCRWHVQPSLTQQLNRVAPPQAVLLQVDVMPVRPVDVGPGLRAEALRGLVQRRGRLRHRLKRVEELPDDVKACQRYQPTSCGLRVHRADGRRATAGAVGCTGLCALHQRPGQLRAPRLVKCAAQRDGRQRAIGTDLGPRDQVVGLGVTLLQARVLQLHLWPAWCPQLSHCHTLPSRILLQQQLHRALEGVAHTKPVVRLCLQLVRVRPQCDAVRLC
mmetsp:Transcript_9707/g.24116  ORF Transcript_9707/g.24116 Transcript_9707/m.24116 type:complete len:224 (+) Transcript_9707:325-996(+)